MQNLIDRIASALAEADRLGLPMVGIKLQESLDQCQDAITQSSEDNVGNRSSDQLK